MEFKKREIKLFILSGKARSGKDSVYEIIKEFYYDKKVINLAFGYYLKNYTKRIIAWDGSEETKPRTFLQNLGIELIQKKIDQNLLIRRILEDIQIFSYFYDIIVVTDARLVAEVESLKAVYPKATLIRVKRLEENDLLDSEKKHLTETDLDNYQGFDYEVVNDDYVSFKTEILQILKDGKNE